MLGLGIEPGFINMPNAYDCQQHSFFNSRNNVAKFLLSLHLLSTQGIPLSVREVIDRLVRVVPIYQPCQFRTNRPILF